MGITFSKEQIIFTLSWLSNCNQGKVFDNSDLAQTYAMDTLVSAFQDREITELTGNFLGDNQELLWGPYTSSAKPVFQQYDEHGHRKTGKPVSDKYVTNNAMFLAKAQEQVAGKTLYVVAIAGTNMDSPWGWFSEDLQVGGDLKPLPWGNNTSPIIAPGTAEGVKTLIDLGQSHQVMSLLEALRKDLDSNKETEIAVTGHSLGGALSPVFAVYLKENLKDFGPKVKVVAYPSAGPTPGTQEFVDHSLKTLDGYVATWNEKDIVPHAWDPKYMKLLANIYEEMGSSASIPPLDIVKAAIAWAMAQPGPINPYCQAEFTNQFCQELYPASKVNYFKFLEEIAQDPFTMAHLIANMLAIYEATDKSVPFGTAKDNMMHYLTQAGKQHTIAYADTILGHGLETKPFREALEKYLAPDEKDQEVVRIELKSANHFLFLIRKNLPG